MADPVEDMKSLVDATKRAVDAIRGAAQAFALFRRAAADGDAAEIAAHPDLAYLDLQIRGFYD